MTALEWGFRYNIVVAEHPGTTSLREPHLEGHSEKLLRPNTYGYRTRSWLRGARGATGTDGWPDRMEPLSRTLIPMARGEAPGDQ